MSALGSTAAVAPASAPLTSHGVPASFDTEQVKDIWNMAVFGHDGRLTFTGITQPWLRESTKRWAAEDLPVRRGKTVTGALRAYVNALAKLSESLRAHRSDHGLQPQALGRRDMETFLHRLGYLEQNGEISAHQRHHTCRMVRHTLRQMRALGLTRAGGPLAGLPEDFALRERDLPPEPEREEPWRALPTEILRQLCNALPVLEERGSRFVRVAVELLIDTGRRPVEVCQLPFNCLDRDGEGKYMLIYDDFKNDKPGRRLPIADATAALIIEQQKSVPRRYPATKPAELKLLPPVCRNPYGDAQ